VTALERSNALGHVLYDDDIELDSNRLEQLIAPWLNSDEPFLHREALIALLAAIHLEHYAPHALTIAENLTPEADGGPPIEVYEAAIYSLASFARQTGKHRSEVLFALARAVTSHPELSAKETAYRALLELLANRTVVRIADPFEYPRDVDIQMLETILQGHTSGAPNEAQSPKPSDLLRT